MTIDSKNAKRCGIFLFFDKDGHADEYIRYLLEDLKNHVDKILVMCNGYMDADTRKMFSEVAEDVVCRANVGMDVAGYREGLFYLGFKELSKYDEVILFNYTFFGPIFPFSEMFEVMDKKDVDFWGITKHHYVPFDPLGKIRYGYIPEHIQSHFLVLRREFLLSYDYKHFIMNFKNPETYVESISEYETIFTKHFEDLGYKWDVYTDTDEWEGYSYCPVMFCIKDMLKKRCPIIKRRSFFTDYNDFLLNTCGEPTAEAYDYIRENTSYDANLIWDNLLRVENMTEIHRAMHLNYMLPSDMEYEENKQGYCVALYIENGKRIEWYRKYVEVIRNADIVYLGGEGISFEGDAFSYIESENYVDFIGKVLQQAESEYVAVLNIKDIEKVKPYSDDWSWQYRDYENMIPSKEYISNILTTFFENEKLGLLVPPVPNHGRLFKELEDGWNGKFEAVKTLLYEKQIDVNIKQIQEPIAPIGGCFWIRRKAIGDLFLSELRDKDERCVCYAIPFILQANRYYTGTAYNMEYAAIEVTNQDFMMRENNKVVFRKYGPNVHKTVINRIENNAFAD